MSFTELVENHRIVVCVGTGGVGKTTVAASLALHGALRGRRAMVLTIDPARRLAQSLGLEAWSGDVRRIDLDGVVEDSHSARGTLDAGMLDQKSAWDDFIGRHAPTTQIRDTILSNEFYQQMSRSFAGSTEYMAIEELCRIDESDGYDLIVLDTPPTSHALDFLEAPRRLEAFLDRSMVGWFVKPYASVGWSAWKTASRSMRFMFEKIEKATGVETLRQVSEFFIAMDAMFDGITARSQRVRGVLSGATTAFVLVTSPDERVLEESEVLTTKLAELGMDLRGAVLNRVHPLSNAACEARDPAELVLRLKAVLERGLASDEASLEWLVENHVAAQRRNEVETERYERFAAALPKGVALEKVPEFDADIHDVAALAKFAATVCP